MAKPRRMDRPAQPRSRGLAPADGSAPGRTRPSAASRTREPRRRLPIPLQDPSPVLRDVAARHGSASKVPCRATAGIARPGRQQHPIADAEVGTVAGRGGKAHLSARQPGNAADRAERPLQGRPQQGGARRRRTGLRRNGPGLAPAEPACRRLPPVPFAGRKAVPRPARPGRRGPARPFLDVHQPGSAACRIRVFRPGAAPSCPAATDGY